MVRSLALDLKPIRVNGVSPGPTNTELWVMGEDEKKAMFQALEGKLLTGRVGSVDDLAESYLGLLKDENIDGAMIRTDGGGLIV